MHHHRGCGIGEGAGLDEILLPAVTLLGRCAENVDSASQLVGERCQSGVCIWLNADAESLLGRLQGDQTTSIRRPALTALPELEEIRQLLTDREPIYHKSADHKVETGGKTIQAVAAEIIALLSQQSSIDEAKSD